MDELIAKYLTCNASDAEKEALMKSLENDAQTRDEFVQSLRALAIYDFLCS